MPIAHQFPSTSSGLIEGVRQDDPVAWNRLAKIYSPLIWYWCRVKAKLSPEDSHDVMQEVYVAVRRKIQGFNRRKKGAFRSWLWEITRNKIIDLIRWKAKQANATGGSDAAERIKQIQDLFPAPHDEEGLSSDDDHRERNILIHRVLEELQPNFDEKNWYAFWQVKIVGRSVAKVAKELGKAESTVNAAVHRVKKRLRKELQELDEFEGFGEPEAPSDSGGPEDSEDI